ncbi:MAG: FAD-dependent oxidoreductase, partial [Christensenellales bacterium]
MEYIKGNPYFCFADSPMKGYSYLNKDIKCDILIVGGGIDGAIANYYLSQEYDVVLVDKSRFGYACTACATALLEYQLDEFASDLLKVMPKEEIVKAYKMGLKSLSRIEKFIKKYGNECQFSRRPTFLYTNKKINVADLEEEYKFRQENGFDCKLYY